MGTSMNQQLNRNIPHPGKLYQVTTWQNEVPCFWNSPNGSPVDPKILRMFSGALVLLVERIRAKWYKVLYKDHIVVIYCDGMTLVESEQDYDHACRKSDPW